MTVSNKQLNFKQQLLVILQDGRNRIQVMKMTDLDVIISIYMYVLKVPLILVYVLW